MYVQDTDIPGCFPILSVHVLFNDNRPSSEDFACLSYQAYYTPTILSVMLSVQFTSPCFPWFMKAVKNHVQIQFGIDHTCFSLFRDSSKLVAIARYCSTLLVLVLSLSLRSPTCSCACLSWLTRSSTPSFSLGWPVRHKRSQDCSQTQKYWIT